MIDQSTFGSTIDHSKDCDRKRPSDQISTVSVRRFVKLCRTSRAACTCFRSASRSDIRCHCCGSVQQNLRGFGRAVLDKKGSKRPVAQRHHTNAPVTFFPARRRSVSFLPYHSQTASPRAAKVPQSKELTVGEVERSLRPGGSRELGKPF